MVKVTLTLCEKRPRHVKREAMFLLNQGVSNIPHPYDISADDGLGGTKHKNTLPDFRK